MSKKVLITFPLLGLSTAGVFAGYKAYRLVWPQTWFEPALIWGEKLTFEQHLRKMNVFKQEISNNEYEVTVSLRDVPMPGNTMLWVHEDDEEFWKQRSNHLKQMQDRGLFGHIPHEENKLKSWCSLRLNTRVYVRKGEKDTLQFRISKDDHISASSISSVIDLSDIKNNCSRLVTNEEFYEGQMIEKKSTEWTTNNCDKLSKDSYVSTGNKFSNCLKPKTDNSPTKVLASVV